jgi:hypothetical protein
LFAPSSGSGGFSFFSSLKEKINVKKEMSHEELEFHYFM